MKAGLRFVGAALIVSLVAGGATARAQPPGPGPIPPDPTDQMTPAQVQQLFDAMLVMQAQEALSLTDQQYAQFLTRLKVLQDARRRSFIDRQRLINELQRLTNQRAPRPNVSDADLKQRLTALEELESRSAAEIRKAYNAIDEVLDIFQRARFRVVEEQIERRKLELVGRARQMNRQRQPPPLRQPPPPQ